MVQYLLDTNHASAVWQNQPKIVARIATASNAQFLLPLPCIAELWFMVFKSSRVTENELNLRAFLAGFQKAAFDDVAAVEFGYIKAGLRKIGQPILTTDIQIAAIARSRAITLLTADTHFGHIGSLTTENWLA